MNLKKIILIAGILFIVGRLAVALAASNELAGLQASFLKGEYDTVASSAGDMIKRGASQRDALLYLRGVSAVKLKDYELAQSSLKQLIDDFPSSRWAAQGRLSLGDVLEMTGKPQDALELYSRFQKEPASEPYRSQFSYRIGRLQRQFGRWEESKASLQQAASTSGSLGTSQASEILNKEEFYFSAQVGAFSTESNANKLASELKNRGYDAFVVKASMDGKILNKVRVGKFSAKAEAEEKAQKLRQDGFPARVVP